LGEEKPVSRGLCLVISKRGLLTGLEEKRLETFTERIMKELLIHRDDGVAAVHAGWRKSGSPGQYLGVKKAVRRRIARPYIGLSLSAIAELFSSDVMDLRSVGAMILLETFRKSDPREQERIFREFLHYRHLIDDWELVDDLSPVLIGSISNGSMIPELDLLATSSRMWDRRMAMVSTLWSVKKGDLDLPYRLSRMLLGDQETLVQKAIGWVLREAGKKDPERLRSFLREQGKSLSRTTMGVAVEGFTKEERKLFRQDSRNEPCPQP
jgi:3-methyladenine DNA glycosylase AlkD